MVLAAVKRKNTFKNEIPDVFLFYCQCLFSSGRVCGELEPTRVVDRGHLNSTGG